MTVGLKKSREGVLGWGRGCTDAFCQKGREMIRAKEIVCKEHIGAKYDYGERATRKISHVSEERNEHGGKEEKKRKRKKGP